MVIIRQKVQSESILGERTRVARDFHDTLEQVKGLSNKEIGDLLGFTENTAKYHLKSILSKLGVRDRTEAAKPPRRLYNTASFISNDRHRPPTHPNG